MSKEIDSHDVRPGHLAAIASGALIVRDVRAPHVDESNDAARTGGGRDIPAHLRMVGVTVGAHRSPRTRLERAAVLSVGEGVAIVQFAYDGTTGTLPWDQLEATAPVPVA